LAELQEKRLIYPRAPQKSIFEPVIAPKQFTAFGCKTWRPEDTLQLRLVCVLAELAFDF
jgi:hypothetical protein